MYPIGCGEQVPFHLAQYDSSFHYCSPDLNSELYPYKGYNSEFTAPPDLNSELYPYKGYNSEFAWFQALTPNYIPIRDIIRSFLPSRP